MNMNHTTPRLRMTRKFFLLFALLWTSTQHACDAMTWFEIKPSYFVFSTAPMNDVYDSGGLEIQGSVSVPMCQYVDFYSSIGFRQAWGNALNSDEKTILTVIPVDIGVKPVFNFRERYNYFI